jgi:hypothetical protein
MTSPDSRQRSRPAIHALLDGAASDAGLLVDETLGDGLADDWEDDELFDDDVLDDDWDDDDPIDGDPPDDGVPLAGRIDRLTDRQLQHWLQGVRRPPPGARPRREAPWPLRRAVPQADAFPVDALGPGLAAAARAIQARTLAPLALCGQAVLGAAALAAQAHADVQLPDGRQRPLSLALLSVAETAERLDRIEDLALRAVRTEERRRTAAWADDMGRYRIERAVWRTLRRAGRERDRARLRAHLDAAGPEPTPPVTPTLYARELTADGLRGLLTAGQPSIGLFDAGGWSMLTAPGRATVARRRLADALSLLWDDGSAELTSKRDGVVRLEGKRLTSHLAAGPGEGLAGLMAPEASSRRLFSRLLCVMPASTIGTRLWTEARDARIDATAPDLERFHGRITALLRAAPAAAAPLPMTRDAARLWRIFGEQTEAALASGGAFDGIEGAAAVAAEQVARIAGVITLYGHENAREIATQTVAGAIELVRHYLAEARRIAGQGGEDAESHRARAVLGYITGLGRKLVHLAEIYQCGPRSIRDAASARQAMRVLERHGYVESLPEDAVIDGERRREAWRILVPPPAADANDVIEETGEATPPEPAAACPATLAPGADATAAPTSTAAPTIHADDAAKVAKVAKVPTAPASPAAPSDRAADAAKVAKVVATPALPATPADCADDAANVVKAAKILADPTAAPQSDLLPARARRRCPKGG